MFRYMYFDVRQNVVVIKTIRSQIMSVIFPKLHENWTWGPLDPPMKLLAKQMINLPVQFPFCHQVKQIHLELLL